MPESWTFSIPDDPNGYVRPYEDRDDEDYYDDDGYHDGFDWSGPLQSLLTSLAKTRLKKLALTSFASPSSVLETLRTVGLPETVVELDLSDSSLDGNAVELLLADTSLLRRVKRLVLRNVPATKEEIAPLAARGLEVTHSEGGGATYRFLVGME